MQDLRHEGNSTPRPYQTSRRLPGPTYTPAIETLFDRPGFVGDIERLLDEKTLAGTEVLTIENEMAPIAGVRYHTSPKVRDKVEALLEAGDETVSVRPEPELRLEVEAGWPGVMVAPVGDRSVQVQRVRDGSEDDTEALREAIGAHTYFLSVSGIEYPILSMEGSILGLGTEVQFSSPSRGSIHNGANRLFFVAERTAGDENGASRSRARSKDEVRFESFRPRPVLSLKTMPGPHDITITGRSDGKTVHFDDDVEATVARPEAPTVRGTGYRFGEPPRSPNRERYLNRRMAQFLADLGIPHPPDGAILLGARYRIGTRSNEGWNYGPEQFQNFSAEVLRWQLESERDIDQDRRQASLALGEWSPMHDRRVEFTFVDEMGRSVGQQTVVNEASEVRGGFRGHEGLAKRFAQFVEQSAAPAEKDVVRFYDRADAEIETLKAEAESVIESRSPEEVPLEEFQPPNARLSLSVVEGKTVELTAAESGHPNGLALRYRFDWTNDETWDTEYRETPTVEWTYDTGGTKTAAVQAQGEIEKTDTATAEIILPRVETAIDFDVLEATVDATGSVADPAFPLEYRFAWELWGPEVSYSSGDRVYYEATKTIYEAVTSTTAGVAPPDALGGEWKVPSWDPSGVAVHDYTGDEGTLRTVAVEVRDTRLACDDGLREVYIPSLTTDRLSVETQGGNATVQIDQSPVPDQTETTYRFDWEGDGKFDTGYQDTAEKTYDYGGGTVDSSKTIVVEEKTSLGATSLADATAHFITAFFSTDYASGDETISVDASGSTSTASENLEYRFRTLEKTPDTWREWTPWGGPTREIEPNTATTSSNGMVAVIGTRIQLEARGQSTGSTGRTTESVSLIMNTPTLPDPGSGLGSGPNGVNVDGDRVSVSTQGESAGRQGIEFRAGRNGNYGNWGRQSFFEARIPESGSQTISIQARDPSLPNATTASTSLEIPFPTASFTTTTNGNTVSVDATGSTHPNGKNLRYRWDWTGDGTWDTSLLENPTLSHVYQSTGTYTIRLEVRGPSGEGHKTTSTIDITEATV
jgi:hypothetical protein